MKCGAWPTAIAAPAVGVGVLASGAGARAGVPAPSPPYRTPDEGPDEDAALPWRSSSLSPGHNRTVSDAATTGTIPSSAIRRAGRFRRCRPWTAVGSRSMVVLPPPPPEPNVSCERPGTVRISICAVGNRRPLSVPIVRHHGEGTDLDPQPSA